MKLKQGKLWTLVLTLIAVSTNVFSAELPETSISGNLQLDSSWDRVLYISQIKSFDDMFAMSNNIIIEKVMIDENGDFKFSTKYLPTEDQLYRIHLSKKGDPPASLIIGGKDENHLFLVAHRNSAIAITNTDQKSVFQNIKINGSPINQFIQKTNEIASYLDSSDFESSAIKTEFISKAIYEKLRYVADTSTLPLVSLFAIYKSNFESNYKVNQEFYELYLDKWEQEESLYFKEFRKKFPVQKSNELLYRSLIAVSFLVLGFGLSFLRPNPVKKEINQLKDLSLQERKIFGLIQEGKSNKEISEDCNIGLSTVKSHVSNIYSKLDIKSRKEALDVHV